jgi:class 3 adenylate cyclase
MAAPLPVNGVKSFSDRGEGLAVGTSGLVTILFTDLVGSTALSQDVGDEVADDLRRDHFQVLRRAIGRTGGSEVKTIGDALMADELGLGRVAELSRRVLG